MRRALEELRDWLAAILTLFALLFFLLIADSIWTDYYPDPPGEAEAQMPE
jgi:hypothetical protein